MKFTVLLLLFPFFAFSQSAFQRDNTALRRGNQAYQQEDFQKAVAQYQAALEINAGNEKAAFNLGNALYKAKQWDLAAKQFDKVAQSTKDKDLKAKSFHNIGNSLMEQKQYDKAVESFKNTLRINSQDADARYNLAYALAKMKQEEQKQKDKNKDKEEQNKDEQDNQQEQNKQDSQNQEEKKQQEQENQKPENGNKEEDKKEKPAEPKESKEQQKQESKMSNADAQRLLDALKSEEEKVRQRYQKARTKSLPPLNSGKDW